jgi:hypothetical protein
MKKTSLAVQKVKVQKGKKLVLNKKVDVDVQAPESETQITIWSEAYRPFIMGGNVHAPLKTSVPATELVDLGKGYKGYIVTSPRGKTFVIESITGGIVGDSLEVVRKDVEQADETVVKEQINAGLKRFKECEAVSPAQFWNALRAD